MGIEISLRPMTDAEYDRWRRRSVDSYAANIMAATGRSPESAGALAQSQFDELLPQGRATPTTWLFVIDQDGRQVGTLWLGPHPHRQGFGYVYDIEIDESARGQGLGRAAMLAAEDVLRGAGISEVGLNVFGFNAGAEALYRSLGYRVVSTQMTKPLTPPA